MVTAKTARFVGAKLRLTWQEVVADQHAEQHEVVDDALQVILEAQDFRWLLKLELQVVPQQAHLLRRIKHTSECCA